MADVYLTYPGFPVQGGAQSYAESARRSKELIDNSTYALFPEYTDMIKPANRNLVEFIFQVQHEKDIRNNGLTPVTCLHSGALHLILMNTENLFPVRNL